MSGSFWDERYSEGFVYGEKPNDFVVEVAPKLPAGKALCIAEGQGRNAVYLAMRGFEVTAVDLSSVGLKHANELAARHGVSIKTVVADLATYDFGKELHDAVVAIWCHLPAPLRRQVHRAAAESLRPGGAVVVECYTPEQLMHGTGGPPDVSMLPTLDALKEDFAGLDFAVAQELTREIHEGRYHEGLSAVARILAFRR